MAKKNTIQYKKKSYVFPVVLSLLIMAGAAYGLAFVWQGMQDTAVAASPSDTSAVAPLPLSADGVSLPESIAENSVQTAPISETPRKDVSSRAQSESQSGAQSTAVPNSGSVSESDEFHPPREDYPFAVKASEKVPNSYFDDAIFFGDSISTGITNYNVMPNADVIAFIGISSVNAISKECIETDDGVKTMLDAAKQYGEKKKVYIMLGGNGLGYDKETFIKGYTEFVNAVKLQYPDAKIYIQTMMPVTDYVSKTYPSVSNEIIDEYNLAIQEMAKDEGVYLVDAACALMDENGKLPNKASPVDGMHFSAEYYHKWFDYLKAHTVKDNR